jgi:hypothetical protein
MTSEPTSHLTLGNVALQQIQVTFDGGRIVSDAGLLTVRALEKPLRIIADLAERLPDPRSPKYIQHSKEAILTQEVYQILAGYPDFNDAQTLRDDPLFKILANVSPDGPTPLACGSTLARFDYAFTRRQAELPPEERPAILEMGDAQCQRLHILNDYLVDLFIRTRLSPPSEIILDGDCTDDPTHGQQTLSGYHGYYRQHQYYPLLVYEGHTGFPLAAWLRPGTVHGSCGAVDILKAIVQKLRAAWPEVRICVRSDNGLAVPELYQFCEAEHLPYAFGYATNAVLQRATATAFEGLQTYYAFYGHREPHVQRFEEIGDYQADSWDRPRRIVAKLEITPQGSQRRFVVTNREESPEAVYRDFYVQRGAVPEQPIGEMKNGLQADRLSACGFRANAFRLLVHTLAYAIVVLFREALASVPELAKATVSSLRTRLWKIGAVLHTSARRIWVRVSETWPCAELWGRVVAAVQGWVASRREGVVAGASACGSRLM